MPMRAPDTAPAVLIVEDEPLIRMEAVDMIRDSGFRTYAAASADAALTLMERHEDIALLFTDVDMPGSMNGLALARLVFSRWPTVRIVIASGIVNLPAADIPPEAAFFPKPYLASHITKALHEMLHP